MNHLQSEKSPYLQMHSDNPVDWYPWGPEAFALARTQDKPVFLSIGYSACHWCHVIAHESFEDEAVAALLNAEYVSVKVDKEERPDVDAVYMDAVQLSLGSGGWPMTLLLTPEGEPFFAATYLPKESRGGAMGLKELLRTAADLWRDERASVLRTAEELTRRMRALTERQAAPSPEPMDALCGRAVKAYAAAYDAKWGGFGGAPKFPSAHNLLFLLAHYERTGEESALSMATGTLDAMFRGGMFDHIGGGFCRYSVDRKWLTPHFEKMLYDNALLLWAYAEAWRVTGKPLYRSVAERTAEYVLRELTGAEGAFYCAQDADSEGREGAYYVFTPGEIRALLGDADGGRFCRRYDITPEGNFEGASIPNLLDCPDFEREDERTAALRARVYEYRRSRLPLGLDDKVLTSWNGLMIAALCAAARALERPAYLEAARRAERFLRERVTGEGGAPLLRYRDGEAKGEGVLADYAYVALALTALYRATGSDAYRQRAWETAEEMLARFGGDGAGLYLYSNAGEQLVTRPKETWDGAMPSGNSCAALALTRLAEDTGDARWRERAQEQLRFMAGVAAESPIGYGFALLAMEERLKGEA